MTTSGFVCWTTSNTEAASSANGTTSWALFASRPWPSEPVQKSCGPASSGQRSSGLPMSPLSFRAEVLQTRVIPSHLDHLLNINQHAHTAWRVATASTKAPSKGLRPTVISSGHRLRLDSLRLPPSRSVAGAERRGTPKQFHFRSTRGTRRYSLDWRAEGAFQSDAQQFNALP